METLQLVLDQYQIYQQQAVHNGMVMPSANNNLLILMKLSKLVLGFRFSGTPCTTNILYTEWPKKVRHCH